MKKHYDFDVETLKETNLPMIQRILKKRLNQINLYDFFCSSEKLLERANKLNFSESLPLLKVIRSVCRLIEEENILISDMRELSFVNDIDIDDNSFTLDSIFGEYKFSQVLTVDDCSPKAYRIYKNGGTIGNCHAISFRNMLYNHYESDEIILGNQIPIDKSELLTFFARSLFKNSYYLHSAIYYDGYVYDITNNIKMDITTYKQLVGYEHVSSIDQDTIVKDVEFLKKNPNPDNTLKRYLSNRERVLEETIRLKK